jgi:hypothetical protein
MSDDSCDPNRVNLRDGGANRNHDTLFGIQGLHSIVANDPWFEEKDCSGLDLKELRKLLWKHPKVRAQRNVLESILCENGCVLLFHPVAHPELAAIELLWRDIKWDYRTSWKHSLTELKTCVSQWLSPAGEGALQRERYLI